MTQKKPAFKLIDFRSICQNNPSYNDEDHFKIDSMVNTTQYRAGQFLSEFQVNELVSLGFNIDIRQTRNSDF